MTTSTIIGVHHRSLILRVLAPGPVALGMRAFFDPTLWQAMWTRRHVAKAQPQPQAEAEDVVARRVAQ